jgi:hypothetical protein
MIGGQEENCKTLDGQKSCRIGEKGVDCKKKATHGVAATKYDPKNRSNTFFTKYVLKNNVQSS